MNLEKTCRFKKVLYAKTQTPKKKFYQKLNFFIFIRRSKKIEKKFSNPLKLKLRQYNSPGPYMLQLSYHENFHLSKHPRVRFTGSFAFIYIF